MLAACLVRGSVSAGPSNIYVHRRDQLFGQDIPGSARPGDWPDNSSATISINSACSLSLAVVWLLLRSRGITQEKRSFFFFLWMPFFEDMHSTVWWRAPLFEKPGVTDVICMSQVLVEVYCVGKAHTACLTPLS